MSDVSLDNSFNDLLKTSRGWQLQWDIKQLLNQVSRDANELLRFDLAAMFLLEQNGVTEVARWPENFPDATPAESRLETAEGVIQAGRTTFVRKEDSNSVIVCAPLLASRQIIGALFLESSNPDRVVSDRDQQFIDMFAQQAAACLEHARLYQTAITDPLTGLFCHRHFQQEVEQAVRRAMRNERPVSLLLMDLDHFKQLNDNCGHDVGNQCLLQVAEALRKTFRGTDVLARFGGDEFEMLLPDTAVEQAESVAQNLRAKVCELQFPQDRKVSATIGVAGYPHNAPNAQALFLSADAALYKAKEAGRNCVMRAQGRIDDLSATPVKPDRARQLTRSAGQKPASGKEGQPEVSTGGEMVDGHVVLRRLGSGSTGEVLLVIQPGLEREVALKRPLTPHLTSEQSQIFVQEARVTAALNHPGVLPVHTIGRDHDSRNYYTMKPLVGRSLEDILDARRKGNMNFLHEYTPGRLLDILLRVSETIAYAHERGTLHLDIRPANVLVGNFGEVTVIDWGSGSSETNRRQSGNSPELKLVGSPAFLAPELVRGGHAKRSAACDVFSLGTLLYLLLTDKLPFQRPTTASTLDALLKGEFVPPDLAAEDAGIDSLLSELCSQSLSLDPARRPDAKDFARRLGRYIRHEADWTTIEFGPGSQALSVDQWTSHLGEWDFADDHWTATEGEAILVWNAPVPGSFRFTCEGWVDNANTELSIIGHRPAYGTHTYRTNGGYFFQLGAESGRVTKLARHDADVLFQPAERLLPGKRYLIEMQYQDEEGLVHCAINGKRVLTYRELFPFSGSNIGFYAYTAGTHFRPIKLERKNWNLQIPALRAADRSYQYGHYEQALEYYQEIASAIPGTRASFEATLKLGMCQVALKNDDAARKSFRALAGTPFEPFALAEEAILNKYVDNDESIRLFTDLIDRFPGSQARIRVLDAAKHNFDYHRETTLGRSLTKDIEAKVVWNQLGVRCFNYPVQSQLKCQAHVAQLQAFLGKWEEGLNEAVAFERSLARFEWSSSMFKGALHTLAMALGRDELLPDGAAPDQLAWDRRLIVCCAIRKDSLPAWLSAAENFPPWDQASLHFAAGDAKRGRAVIETHARSGTDSSLDHRMAPILVEARIQDLVENYIYARRPKHISDLYSARFHLEGANFDAAATVVRDYEVPVHLADRRIYLWKVMLHSLGMTQTFDDALPAYCERLLCGPMLELAQMFLGVVEPRPTALWPQPHWYPDLRLWLALWLEAKGRKSDARDVILPSRDPRYNFTNCQPAIEALLKRLQS